MTDPRLILCLATGVIAVVIAFEFVQALRRTLWRPPPFVPGSSRGTRISVIVPARNEEQDLGRALESLLAQVDVEFEVIVVNDHSTDLTGEIADAVARADPRVRVIHNPEFRRDGWGNAMRSSRRLAWLAASCSCSRMRTSSSSPPVSRRPSRS